MFKPLKLLFDRVETHGTDSDATMFMELLYAGEFIIKATASTMVALVQNDRDGHRYRLLHALVRADGVGEWAAVLDQTLTGPASQHLVSNARDMQRVFTERSVPGSWQDRAVKALYFVLTVIIRRQTSLPRDHSYEAGSPFLRNCATRPEVMAL